MIKHCSFPYRSPDDLGQLPSWVLTHPRNQMLVQVFSGVLEPETLGTALSALRAAFAGAAILGSTTAGEIVDGQVLESSLVLSIACFEHSTVRSAWVAPNDDLAQADHELGLRLAQPDARVVIVFGCGIKTGRTVYAQAMLDALCAQLPQVAISGGQAGDNGLGQRTWVFTDQGMGDSGFAAVSIAGPALKASNAYTLSWVPIGKELTITRAEGSRVYSIDGRTPYDIYCHYLGQDVADGLPLSAADFPLMIERDGVLMAIHATGVNSDGSFNYIHNFQAGERLKFGYCHAGLLTSAADRLQGELQSIDAQVAFVYSCVSRKWILGADVVTELAPLARLAPVSGFFCYGEYFGKPQGKPLFLSQTLTALCLSEQPSTNAQHQPASRASAPIPSESGQFKTMRVLHRLVDTSARELEAMHALAEEARQLAELEGLRAKQSLEELRIAQTQLVAAEKMASLGQLVANVAHEINTPMGAIQSGAQSILTGGLQAMQGLYELGKTLDPASMQLFLQMVAGANVPAVPRSTREMRALARQVTRLLQDADVPCAQNTAQTLVLMNAQDRLMHYLPLLRHPASGAIFEIGSDVATLLASTHNIQAAVDRVSSIVATLRAFSQQESSGAWVWASLRDGIEAVLAKVKNQVRQGVDWCFQWEDLPPVYCMPEALEQVWNHLIRNALQAMAYQGQLTIGLRQQGTEAVVTVTDTGSGIAEAIQGRIFEPFFTTRPPGEGAGMGLDMVKKIVAKHQGRVEVQTQVGVGATFCVYLPMGAAHQA